jgi:dTDP-4-dehydrorhamnose 3,5-epimerase
MGKIKLIETGLPGLIILEPMVFSDDRGYFFESYNQKDYAEAELDFNPVQDNESCSVYGVIRGLHFQKEPHAQTKLVRVIEGEIFDVAVDIRKGSPTCGKWYGINLSSENKRQFFIPKGFAHGFSVLSKKAIVMYKCDDYYSPQDEGSIFALDPMLAIEWGIKKGQEILSSKDRKNPQFSELKNNFSY